MTVAIAISAGCGSSPDADPAAPAVAVDLVNRAYVVSRDSGDVTVIDLNRFEIIGRVDTRGVLDHMAELNADFTKIYVDSPGTNETVLVDARTLTETKRVKLGAEPTHLALSRDGKYLAVVNEFSNEISFVDTVKDEEVKRIGGFFMPHFVRFAPDGKYAYVANNAAHHITRVDLTTLSIDGHVALDGFDVPPNETKIDGENGFADVQIDKDGVLYGAHALTGRVLVYDTFAKQKKADVTVGSKPWIVYAEHPFQDVTKHVVPNFGDATVSLIKAPQGLIDGDAVPGADQESFGVNYSSLVPDYAYVMNRIRSEIAVVDTKSARLINTIDVGGNTETASTTADGKYIVAAVSSANRVVVIDALTGGIVKTFDGVGKYPWSVTIPRGQNYCH
ncbi:MAG TPA: YncE family protein [Polyangiaceae bacterium]|nr:YncE family protein [Polyangiaceae bacterium]